MRNERKLLHACSLGTVKPLGEQEQFYVHQPETGGDLFVSLLKVKWNKEPVEAYMNRRVQL